MGKFESKLHSPGVMIYRVSGDLDSDDLEKWRDELVKFIKENEAKGACAVLLDLANVESVSLEAVDGLFELLTEPEEVIGKVRMRFALIGVRPFSQRFLRETMPLEEIKHVRARFFHEVAESEALAWLHSMVTSADDLPEVKAATPASADTKTDKTGPLPAPADKQPVRFGLRPPSPKVESSKRPEPVPASDPKPESKQDSKPSAPKK